MLKKSAHVNALATLLSIHNVGIDRVITVTILLQVSSEEAEITIGHINEITTPQFRHYFQFLKNVVLLEDISKA